MARDYRHEYDTYHSRLEQKKRRSCRNRARNLLKKAGKVAKGDGKDADHINGNPRDNSSGNLQALPRGVNRGEKRVRDMKGRTA